MEEGQLLRLTHLDPHWWVQATKPAEKEFLEAYIAPDPNVVVRGSSSVRNGPQTLPLRSTLTGRIRDGFEQLQHEAESRLSSQKVRTSRSASTASSGTRISRSTSRSTISSQGRQRGAVQELERRVEDIYNIITSQAASQAALQASSQAVWQATTSRMPISPYATPTTQWGTQSQATVIPSSIPYNPSPLSGQVYYDRTPYPLMTTRARASGPAQRRHRRRARECRYF